MFTFQAYSENIRLGWKWLELTNTNFYLSIIFASNSWKSESEEAQFGSCYRLIREC
jgi:hypothetical protein